MSRKALRQCERCGKSFEVTLHRAAKGEGRFCSWLCYKLTPRNGKGPNEHHADADGIVHIKLTQGKEALVSPEDYPKVAPFRWCAHRKNIKYRTQFYAVTRIRNPDGRKATLSMHAFIFDPPPGFEVDHIFGDGLDNRRGQTRNVTHRVNCQNMHHRKSSKYPGVSWATREKKWTAWAYAHGKSHYCGYFDKEKSAYLAYKKALADLGVAA